MKKHGVSLVLALALLAGIAPGALARGGTAWSSAQGLFYLADMVSPPDPARSGARVSTLLLRTEEGTVREELYLQAAEGSAVTFRAGESATTYWVTACTLAPCAVDGRSCWEVTQGNTWEFTLEAYGELPMPQERFHENSHLGEFQLLRMVAQCGERAEWLDVCFVPSPTAAAASYPITVDGREVHFAGYVLKDARGNDTNYIRPRDLAWVLNGTDAQFQVDWDGPAQAVTLTTGEPYTVTGQEMTTPFSGDQGYDLATAQILVDGTPVQAEAILITWEGKGYTYIKLRDLCQMLGFTVDWSQETGVTITTGR